MSDEIGGWEKDARAGLPRMRVYDYTNEALVQSWLDYALQEITRLRERIDFDTEVVQANEELGAALVEARAEIARFREHSVTLNTVSYNIAEALGKVERPDDYVGDVEEDLAELITAYEQARGIYTHLGPKGDAAQFRCCTRYVHENLGQRMTYDPALVTCPHYRHEESHEDRPSAGDAAVGGSDPAGPGGGGSSVLPVAPEPEAHTDADADEDQPDPVGFKRFPEREPIGITYADADLKRLRFPYPQHHGLVIPDFRSVADEDDAEHFEYTDADLKRLRFPYDHSHHVADAHLVEPDSDSDDLQPDEHPDLD